MGGSHSKLPSKEAIWWTSQNKPQTSKQYRIHLKSCRNVKLEQFMKHCNQNSLLSEYQSACRKECSCETSLVNDILWGMENQLVTAVVIVDLSTAFNTVDHDLLLDALER